MTLSSSHRRSIMRQCAAGVPVEQVAAAFELTVAQVQWIDAQEVEKSLNRRRVAEPLPGLKERNWKTARPAEERMRGGDFTCKAPDGCGERAERHSSYCGFHHRLFHKPRAAA